MGRGFVTALALNGAGAIHDFEIALAGSTSEDVESELESGDFGTSRETAEWMNDAIAQGVVRGIGLGEADRVLSGRELESTSICRCESAGRSFRAQASR